MQRCRLSRISTERRSPLKVRLTHKLANTLDGVDVSHVNVGDTLDLPTKEARTLIVEGWAEPVGQVETSSVAEISVKPLVSES